MRSANGWFRPVGLVHHVNVAHAVRSNVRAMTETNARAAPLRCRREITEKILAVLEPRLVDAAARARAAEKLATLSDARLRLMAALSDRVALVGAAPADGIALFLLTALLILS